MSRDDTVNERRIRATLLRSENKAGVKEILAYLWQRQSIQDPLFWPERPELSFIGVKNGVERLREDLDSRRLFPLKDTGSIIKSLDQALQELYLFRFENPPVQFRQGLGASLVSMYLLLSRPGSMNHESWPFTRQELEFHSAATRDLIALRREQNRFAIEAEILCTKDADCEAAVEARNLFCFFWRPTKHSRITVYKRVPYD